MPRAGFAAVEDKLQPPGSPWGDVCVDEDVPGDKTSAKHPE